MKLKIALTAADNTASMHLGTIAQENFKCVCCYLPGPVPVTARSKSWVCSRSLACIVGSNPAGIMDV
jgi:hypothetical protein